MASQPNFAEAFQQHLPMAFWSMTRLVAILAFLWSLLPFFWIFNLVKTAYNYISSPDDLKGKVVLITGASSGIGEQLAYEYAKKGACLVIVARRENLINKVAEEARKLGSPDVVPICGDVSRADDCKRFIEEAVNHFGRLDHVVNNAGISSYCPLEDVTDITKLAQVMDVNFWGSIYPTYYAIPHLKRSKGTIFVNASAAAYLHPPGMSFYSASKSALASFYEAMRAELGSDISITIATLGLIDSELSRGKNINKEGVPEQNPELTNAFINDLPVMSAEACVKAILKAVRRKQRNVTEPKWVRLLFMLQTLCPELVEWGNRYAYEDAKIKTRQIKPIIPKSE